MCLESKPVNICEDTSRPIKSLIILHINVGGDEPKKTKKPDNYNQGGIEGSSQTVGEELSPQLVTADEQDIKLVDKRKS